MLTKYSSANIDLITEGYILSGERRSVVRVPYINIRGKKIFYHLGSDFRADFATILFIHGAGGSGENWIHQSAGIQGYNLIAPDLPGHGLSAGPASDNILAYREFIRSFAQELKLGSFFLAGHSMGGAIAMEFALEYPEASKGLIIVGSGARLRVNPAIFEALSRGARPDDIIRYSYYQSTFLEKAKLDMEKVPIEVYQADFKACDEFDNMNRVQNLLLPTLIICGLEDRMTPAKYSEYLSGVIQKSKIVIITDAGHMAMIEQPAQVNRAIGNFLAEQLEKKLRSSQSI